MSDTNLSFVLTEKNSFAFVQGNILSDINPYDVQIKILNVGICGTDLHMWKHGHVGDLVANNPLILGHEASGLVVKCGGKVTKLKEGDRVAIEPGLSCLKCQLCMSGKYNICEKATVLSLPPTDGALQEYINHPEMLCHKLPVNVSNEEGALLEPLSVAVHACIRANVTLGSNVLVIGAGTIGIVNMLVSRSSGADKIVVVDIDENRIKSAKDLGADFVFQITPNSNSKDVIEKIKECLNGFPDKSIECSGSAAGINLAIEATTPGGCVVLVGLGSEKVELPIVNAVIREIDIRGSFKYTNCFPISLSLVSNKQVDVMPLVTHRFTFAETEKAFNTAQNGIGIKVMIEIGKVE